MTILPIFPEILLKLITLLDNLLSISKRIKDRKGSRKIKIRKNYMMSKSLSTSSSFVPQDVINLITTLSSPYLHQ